MAQIEVVPAKGLGRFLAYNKLPRLLYAGMPGFAPPLDVERWTLHGHALNPHFKLVEAQEFLARREGRWVGRVMAQVYKEDVAPVAASRFQFGSLDAIDDIDVVRALTDAAEQWLKERGATRINGPFSPSINGEMGMLIEGFEKTPMFLTPWHPPYMSRHIEALGYEKAVDVVSYEIEITPDVLEQRTSIGARREWKDRLKIRPIDFKRLKQGETQLMSDLFNDGWRDNWGFVPFTKAEFDSIADALSFAVPPEFTMVAELDGKPVAFVVAMPNLFEIIDDLDGGLVLNLPKLISRFRKHKYKTARILLLGVRKELQSSATGGAILLTMIEEMRRRGAQIQLEALEAGWVLEQNLPMRKPIEMFGGKIDKVHRVYEKRV
ncbi:MAG TPA: GNAT family N-acetyltransferase [Methylocystis sp.]|nr:GNAT family N-acetyltransferase [Methylocystis sp.]